MNNVNDNWSNSKKLSPENLNIRLYGKQVQISGDDIEITRPVSNGKKTISNDLDIFTNITMNINIFIWIINLCL